MVDLQETHRSLMKKIDDHKTKSQFFADMFEAVQRVMRERELEGLQDFTASDYDQAEQTIAELVHDIEYTKDEYEEAADLESYHRGFLHDSQEDR